MKPKQFCYILIGALVIILLGAGGGYYWATTKVSSDTEALKQKLAEAETADGVLAQLVSLEKQYQKILPTLPLLDTALPRVKNQSEAVLQIEQLANAAGMSLPSAAFNVTTGAPSAASQTTKEGDALVMPLNFQLAGSYEQLQTFLQSLEKLNRYTSVTNLAITKADKPKSLSLNFSLNVYLKP